MSYCDKSVLVPTCGNTGCNECSKTPYSIDSTAQNGDQFCEYETLEGENFMFGFRVLKFRTWDSAEKIMKEMWHMVLPNTTNGEFRRNIYMQYTGLKDKNEVEIYEGDIVRYIYNCDTPWASDSVAIIGFEGTGFNMTPLRGKGGVNGWLVSIPHNEGKLFEVIGNIYENPELL